MKRLILIVSVGLASAGALVAQSAEDPNEGAQLSWDVANNVARFNWWGKGGRTYFV